MSRVGVAAAAVVALVVTAPIALACELSPDASSEITEQTIVAADAPHLPIENPAPGPDVAPPPITPGVTLVPQPPTYPDNLDGWIAQAQDVLTANGIPAPSHYDIYRNVIRESSGDPMAINDWDVNAQNGIPSKGLLQTIDPTFSAYHVPGTAFDPFDPVANIAAACNYALHVYGGMSQVFGAY